VAGIGTGGTVTGAGKYLKEQNPEIRVIAVDPVGSIYAHYKQHGTIPPPEEQSTYLIDGIGGSIKATSAWLEYVDEVITIDDKTAYQATLELARTEAIFGGSSSGAAAAGARQVAAELPADALVVTLFPDSGERYLSRLNDEWMQERGLLDEPADREPAKGP
jgi:cystathionine beta-synthase